MERISRRPRDDVNSDALYCMASQAQRLFIRSARDGLRGR